MKNRTILALTTVTLLVAVLLVGLAMPTVQAAPLFAPTPVSITHPANANANLLLTPFNRAVLTADTTADCRDIGNYTVADVIYGIDQGTTNTVTITPKWSNDSVAQALGTALVSANAADATEAVQVALYGKYLCLFADVTNSNPVTVTVSLLAK